MNEAMQYAAARSRAPLGAPITVLHIGADQTEVAAGSGTEPEITAVMRIGSRRTAQEFFVGFPPTEAELERAIAAVEDELMRVRNAITGPAALFTSDAAIRGIARLAGESDAPEVTLGLDAVERSFGRFAAVITGRPASVEGIPESREFAATILILREFMHHLQYSSITITEPC